MTLAPAYVPEAVADAFDGPMQLMPMLDAMRANKMTAWIPMTVASYEDRGFLHDLLNQSMWNVRLRARGFLGLVKCDRCHRPARCVHRVGDRLYGATCARLAS